MPQVYCSAVFAVLSPTGRMSNAWNAGPCRRRRSPPQGSQDCDHAVRTVPFRRFSITRVPSHRRSRRSSRVKVRRPSRAFPRKERIAMTESIEHREIGLPRDTIRRSPGTTVPLRDERGPVQTPPRAGSSSSQAIARSNWRFEIQWRDPALPSSFRPPSSRIPGSIFPFRQSARSSSPSRKPCRNARPVGMASRCM